MGAPHRSRTTVRPPIPACMVSWTMVRPLPWFRPTARAARAGALAGCLPPLAGRRSWAAVRPYLLGGPPASSDDQDVAPQFDQSPSPLEKVFPRRRLTQHQERARRRRRRRQQRRTRRRRRRRSCGGVNPYGGEGPSPRAQPPAPVAEQAGSADSRVAAALQASEVVAAMVAGQGLRTGEPVAVIAGLTGALFTVAVVTTAATSSVAEAPSAERKWEPVIGQ